MPCGEGCLSFEIQQLACIAMLDCIFFEKGRTAHPSDPWNGVYLLFLLINEREYHTILCGLLSDHSGWFVFKFKKADVLIFTLCDPRKHWKHHLSTKLYMPFLSPSDITCQMSALVCGVCMEKYSTELHSDNAPLLLESPCRGLYVKASTRKRCGHTYCASCLFQIFHFFCHPGLLFNRSSFIG